MTPTTGQVGTVRAVPYPYNRPESLCWGIPANHLTSVTRGLDGTLNASNSGVSDADSNTGKVA